MRDRSEFFNIRCLSDDILLRLRERHYENIKEINRELSLRGQTSEVNKHIK